MKQERERQKKKKENKAKNKVGLRECSGMFSGTAEKKRGKGRLSKENSCSPELSPFL